MARGDMSWGLESPAGTVTFLLTDVEGSTALWQAAAGAMDRAVARHDEIVGDVVSRHGGVLVKSRGEGDSTFAVFSRATAAVSAALDLQRVLRAEPWPEGAELRVRAALHTGEAELRDGDYFGPAVNRCSRLRDAAHGDQVVASRATVELVREVLPRGTQLVDLGAHRLKDLAVAEHVFQVGHTDLRTEFPALRSLDASPHNLPIQLTSFVGREKEIAEVAQLLLSARMVTLIGPGGAGKTRLALQVAAEVLDRYPQGAWLVDLASTSDGSVIPQTVASILGVRRDAPSWAAPRAAQEPERSLVDKIVETLRPSRAIVLLDNCEHLVSECAAFAETILRSCPQVWVFSTSREPLGVPGEARWRVPPLATPDPRDTLDSLSTCEAVRLFVDRAVLNQSDFALTDENAGAVVEVCRRLDGMPLAIELAAAWVSSLTPAQLLARLDDRFRLLASTTRAALPRQQTLRAAVDWSYDLLSPAERTLLENLSIFGGGFSLEGAERVCAEDGVEASEVVSLLARLVDKSLVIRDTDGPRIRYRLLETIRQYGWEKVGATPVIQESARNHAALRKEAEFWVVEYGAQQARIKDARGLAYLARLVASPGREFHALDLAGAVRDTASDDDVLDAEARADYKARLAELEQEADEARSWNDGERESRARDEIDFLTQELARAVGLGGRARKSASAGERARTSVTKAVRGAIKRIAEHMPELGAYLSSTVHTGTFLVYRPDARHPLTWNLGGVDS